MYFAVYFFISGEEVKQADVILLGFPLMMSMPEDVRKNDLRIYENVIDSEYFFSGHVMITSQSALIQTKYSRMYFLINQS